MILLMAAVLAAPMIAQETTATAAPAAVSTAAPVPVIATDSAETRQQLHEVLGSLPPQVGKTLKLDPTLWSNQSYLANYPTLAAFVVAHPEVPHSPAYFLENVYIPGDPSPETNSFRIWSSMMETISIFTAILTFGGIFAWLIKTLIDHRRWSRVSRIQAEVHNKLLDRFASNDELLKYIETPAGRHFLESAPIPLEAGPRAVAAPIGRVLWSVQVGIVVAAAGIGLRLVSWNVDKDVSQPMAALGTLGIAIGGGFIVAAAVSFILSRRLGLWQPPQPEASTGE
jgi:hypothetical protein